MYNIDFSRNRIGFILYLLKKTERLYITLSNHVYTFFVIPATM